MYCTFYSIRWEEGQISGFQWIIVGKVWGACLGLRLSSKWRIVNLDQKQQSSSLEVKSRDSLYKILRSRNGLKSTNHHNNHIFQAWDQFWSKIFLRKLGTILVKGQNYNIFHNVNHTQLLRVSNSHTILFSLLLFRQAGGFFIHMNIKV